MNIYIYIVIIELPEKIVGLLIKSFTQFMKKANNYLNAKLKHIYSLEYLRSIVPCAAKTVINYTQM